MNKARYEALPADLRAVIDANSGIALAKQIGRVWDEAEQPGRAAAKASGASFHSIEGEELARWQAATAGVTEAWIAEMNAAGRSEEHTSELQSLMRISYAVFSLKKKTKLKNVRFYNHDDHSYHPTTQK